MSNIRRQSIISSAIIYFGFVLGFVNTYLFTKEGSFTESQYGVVSTFIAIANIMLAFSNLGAPSVIYKFYPYYKDNLNKQRNDLISWALLTCTVGFILVIVAGYVFKDFVIKKYITNAPELIQYYHLLFPFGFGLTVFTVLEAYAWQEKKSVLTNFLREVLFRLFTTILIVLFFERIISNFQGFIEIYAFTYILLSLILFGYLILTKRIGIHLYISRVTKKFYKKIGTLAGFVWSGGLVYNISNVFDTLVIAAVLPKGMAWVGVYSLAQNITSLIQAPQRGVVSASIAPLSRAWKDKDLGRIKQIYQRSSINQLIFSVGMFSLILLNFIDGIHTFSFKDTYTQALPVFIFIGMMRILDMGTGLNSQIIATSTYWRFEFFTGIILLSLALPLNYILTKNMGVIGPAISNLIALSIYNLIRGIFLWRKVKMQPFTIKSLYTVLLGIASYAVCYYAYRNQLGLGWIIARSATFILLFAGGVVLLKLTPDIFHVFDTVKRRIRRN
jgi:O-antigen/teichoic acid export membrane protein